MRHRPGALVVGAVGIAILLALNLSCGPRQTPEQLLAELRYQHEMIPVGYTTLYDAEGAPTLLIDLQLTNQGQRKLDHLTVLVRVTGGDGLEKLFERVTLDLEELRPGIGERRPIRIPGYQLAEDDQVMVEIEANLPPDVLRALPEFADVAPQS